MNELTDWLLLVLTLPTDNATARMRYWRALKAKGCAVLRDGAYLLPLTADNGMAVIFERICRAGGTAYLVRFASTDKTQEEEFRALFDRTGEYTNFRRSVEGVQRT